MSTKTCTCDEGEYCDLDSSPLTEDAEREEALTNYRAKLAAITDPNHIDGDCLNAVFTGGTTTHGEITGTILAVEHHTGWGLFGPTVYTRVKLCESCVHKLGTQCPNQAEVEWDQVTWLDSVVRNGDGEAAQ